MGAAQIPLKIPEKMLPLAIKPKRFKVAIGGRGSGKSVTVATLLASQVGMTGARVLATREHMNSIEDSVHALVKEQIGNYSMPGFDVQAREIRHISGGGFIYRGLARNLESLKSLHEIDRAWVEEAQSISQESIEKLTPSIRAPGSEIWFTANPRSRKDPFSQRFIVPFEKELERDGYYEDDMHLVIVVNYMDNPWFPPELEQERLYDLENKPRAKYDHIWLGKYDDTVDDAIIAPEWFDACVDAHEKLGFEPRGIEVLTHDPSDNGADAKGLAYRHGNVILDVQEREIGDINEGGDWAITYAETVKPDLFIWDGDGMGVGLRRQFRDALGQKKITLEMFKGSHMPDEPHKVYEPADELHSKKTNKETFKNKRAQYYWLLRDRIYRTWRAVNKKGYTDPDDLISFSGDMKNLDLLRSELCRIPLKYNRNGLIQIMTKEEMKRLGIDSPNMADSVMMSFAIPKPKRRVPPAHARRRRVAGRGGY